MYAAFLAIVIGCSRQPPANLVLITLDTTRADHCSLYDYHLPTTPTLERLGAQGAVFETAYSNTAMTGPSHASLFTGIAPRQHGLLTNGDALPEGTDTIAEILATAGYQTAGIASSFVLDSRFGLDRGFNSWESDFEAAGSSMNKKVWFHHEVPSGFDRRADETTRLALDWLGDRRDPDRPFFLFVHYFEPHGPWIPPEPWRSDFSPPGEASQLESWVALYDASIAFTDFEVGRLIAAVDEMGLGENTLVIVTADHGEGLMDHGVIAHGPHLYEEAVRIPLLMRWPGVIPAGLLLTAPVSLIDLKPTILDLFEAGIRAPHLQGQSLASCLLSRSNTIPSTPTLLYRGPDRWHTEGRIFKGERLGLRSGRWKYFAGGNEPAELYDLEDDPEESKNRLADHPKVVHHLHAELNTWLAEDPSTEKAKPVLSPEERRGLEALGYLQSTAGKP